MVSCVECGWRNGDPHAHNCVGVETGSFRLDHVTFGYKTWVAGDDRERVFVVFLYGDVVGTMIEPASVAQMIDWAPEDLDLNKKVQDLKQLEYVLQLQKELEGLKRQRPS